MMHIFYSFVQIITITKIISCINLNQSPSSGGLGGDRKNDTRICFKTRIMTKRQVDEKGEKKKNASGLLIYKFVALQLIINTFANVST
jgi:hypothetical protein